MRLDDLKVVMIIMTKKIILIQIDINNTVSNVIKINPQTQPQQSLTKPGWLMTTADNNMQTMTMMSLIVCKSMSDGFLFHPFST